MTKTLIVKNIEAENPTAEQVAGLLDLHNCQCHAIDNVNWRADYPYAPKVCFRIAHNSDNILLQFVVDEQYTMATVDTDNGEVWTDSCVEFFITFDQKGYYNFEFTCIGKALLGFRKTKPEVTHAPVEVMQSIQRLSSLGTQTFAERIGDNRWELSVVIPRQALFGHEFESLGGLEAQANLYKCGDKLSKPHFLSWNPIGTETPNFHVSQYFGKVKFE